MNSLDSSIFSCINKTAIVTGGCGLIGREIVKVLCENGAEVYAADTKDSISAQSFEDENIKPLPIDITNEKSVSDAIGSVIKEKGKLDIMVNSAYPRTEDWAKRLENVPYESWNKNINDHMGGYFLCSRAAAEAMKGDGGSIINLGSIYGSAPPDFSMYEGTGMTMPAAYSAIKGGIIAFTKFLASYYAQNNIRVNAISPGGLFDNQPEEFVEKYLSKTPLGRMGLPGDVASAALFLASDASSYITGHNLIVDGGRTI